MSWKSVTPGTQRLAAGARAQLRWSVAAACRHSCGTWPNTAGSERYLRWSGWSVWWSTRWTCIGTSAAPVTLSSVSRQCPAGECCSTPPAPSPLRAPSAPDNHAKCNLQHYLHLFTFTNYIPLKLPRKICQKNVITPSWHSASTEISSLPS